MIDCTETLVEFVVPGKPQAQGRHRTRVMQAGGRSFARMHDDPKSVSHKATIQQHAMEAMSGRAPTMLPVAAQIRFIWAMPKSRWLKRDQRPGEAKLSKPDADNLAKAVLDACNGVVYVDDSQVFKLSVVKLIARQGEPARTEVVFLVA